jgi:HEAT repeat protein
MNHQLIRNILFHAVNLKNSTQLCLGEEMQKIEEGLRRSQITRIVSLSLIVGMMGTTILPAVAQGQIVRVSNRHNAMHLAQLTDPPRPVPTPRKLTKLINSLNHKDRKVRLSAIAKLGSFGPGPVAAVPNLTSLLQDTDAEVRWASASALGEIGPGAKAAVPQLMPLLQDNNASVREIAAYALGEIGSEAKAAVPQLLPLLQDVDPSVRMAAVQTLGQLESVKEIVSKLIPLLQDPNRDARLATVQILENFAPTTVHEAIPSLIKTYYNYQDEEVLKLLKLKGGPQTIVKMIADLHSSNAKINISNLARGLALIEGCEDYSFGSLKIREVMIPALVDNLKDKQSPDRAETASIIARISPAATSAVPALISALSDLDEGVRRSATDALQRIDLMALRQALIANLQHKDQEIRRTAIEVISWLTKDAALINALQDKDETIRQRAINAFLIHPLPPPVLFSIACAIEKGSGGSLSGGTTFTNAIRKIFRR